MSREMYYNMVWAGMQGYFFKVTVFLGNDAGAVSVCFFRTPNLPSAVGENDLPPFFARAQCF